MPPLPSPSPPSPRIGGREEKLFRDQLFFRATLPRGPFVSRSPRRSIVVPPPPLVGYDTYTRDSWYNKENVGFFVISSRREFSRRLIERIASREIWSIIGSWLFTDVFDDRLFSFFFLLEFDFSNFDAKKNSPGSYRIEALGEKLREFFFFFNLGFIRVEVVKKGLVFK